MRAEGEQFVELELSNIQIAVYDLNSQISDATTQSFSFNTSWVSLSLDQNVFINSIQSNYYLVMLQVPVDFYGVFSQSSPES